MAQRRINLVLSGHHDLQSPPKLSQDHDQLYTMRKREPKSSKILSHTASDLICHTSLRPKWQVTKMGQKGAMLKISQ